MKSKIIIIILSIVILISISLLIYQQKTYIKIPLQYECESTILEENNTKFKQVMIININKEQYVESYQNKDVTIYFDEEQYNAVKEIPNTEEATYIFDDKTKTVTSEYNLSEMTDADGNQVQIWYKEYVKNIEESGYKCKVIK